MKYLFTFFIAISGLVGLMACNEVEPENAVPFDDTISISQVIPVGNSTRSGFEEPDIIFSATYSISQDKVTSYNLASLDPAVDSDVLTRAFSDYLTETLGDDFENLGSLENGNHILATDSENILSCLTNCKDNYDKRNGRGRCRFNCWFNFAVEIAPYIIEILRNI